MELPVRSVFDCTPRVVIMFLIVRNKNASAIHQQHLLDLAPSDYHLFGMLNTSLGGQRFTTNAEVEKWMHAFFVDFDRDVYYVGIRKLMPRYEKCLERSRHYVEK